MALATALYVHKGETREALQLAETALRQDGRFSDPNFLKENLWGDRLIADTQRLLQHPAIQAVIEEGRRKRVKGEG